MTDKHAMGSQYKVVRWQPCWKNNANGRSGHGEMCCSARLESAWEAQLLFNVYSIFINFSNMKWFHCDIIIYNFTQYI